MRGAIVPLVQPRDPLWPADKLVRPFAGSYVLVSDARFPMNDARPEKIYVGEPSNRICALCQRSRREGASFRSESHIIPVALGNRRYLSNEECDECNERYAAEHDIHLVNAFTFQRLLFGVRGREGYVGLKPKGDSEIRASGKNQLHIVQGKDEGVQFEILGERSGRLAFDLPSYKVIGMLQALLRSAWLLSPVAFRQRHEYLRHWIEGSPRVPARFLTYSFDDVAFAFTELNLWKAMASETGISSIVLRFVFANTVIVWPLPEPEGEQKPCLIPPFEIGQKNPTVFMTAVKDVAQESQLRPSLEFSYDNRVSHDEAAREPVVKAPSTHQQLVRIPVEIRPVMNGLPGTGIHSFLVVNHQDALRTRFRIHGGDLAANIRVEIDHQTDKVHTNIAVLPWLLPSSKALATVELLLGADGKRLSVHALATKAEILQVSVAISGDFSRLRTLLLMLVRVGSAFSIDLRHPHDADELDFVSLVEIDRIAQSGVVESGAGTVTCTVDDAKLLREHLAREPGATLLSEHGESSFAFAGHVVQLGPVRREFANARLSPADDENDSRRVVFECDSVRDTYAVWKERADARGHREERK